MAQELAEAALSTPPTAQRSRLAGNALPIVLFALFALLPLFAAFNAEAYVLGLATRIMIFSIAALALDLLMGYGALVSFGHAAFVGLGAYTIGILSSHGITEVLFALPTTLIV